MTFDTLTSISPIDGRYGDKTGPLKSIFSEFGLIKYRVLVEISWLQAVSMNSQIPEVPKFSSKSNQFLSVLRAESVKTYLYNRGIDFHRIKAYGMGENQPVAEDNYDDGIDDTVGKDANRRVEIQLIK